MQFGVLLKVVWFDSDVMQLQLEASNGRFSGVARLFAEHDAAMRAADVLRSFPTSVSDVREVVLGTFDPTFAGGGSRLRFRCFNATGHVACDVLIKTDPHSLLRTQETVELTFPVEPAAIDAFVLELGRLEARLNAQAHLRSAT